MSFFRILPLIALGSGLAFSQEANQRRRIPVPNNPPPPAGVPGNAPAGNNELNQMIQGEAPPIAAPGNPQPGVPLGQTKITRDIFLPKLSGDDLARLYRIFTGRRVVVASAASNAEFKFFQPASEQDPLTYDEAAGLLRKAAVIENFVFVPDAENPNIEILTLATGGLTPKQRGLDVYNENTPLPEGDAVISYVMTFNYLKPSEALNIFNQTVGQFGAYGSISAVPNASAVIITENTSLIRKLIDLKRVIDVGSKSDSAFISVRYSDVTELAATLNELFSAQSQSQTTAGVNRMIQPAPGQNRANFPVAGQAPDSGESPPAQIVPDPRTNRLFVMGHPKDIALIKTLVASFDVESSEKTFLRRKLRFLSVSEFLPVASDALTRAFSGTGDASGAGGAPGQGRLGQNRQNTSNRSGLGASAFNSNSSSRNSASSGFGTDGSSSGSGGAAGGTGLSAPNVNTAPESVLVGRTLLVADNITNSIVVQGPPSGLEIVSRLLDQIDVKADQVMISTVFGQLNLGNSLNTGVDWLKTFNAHGDGSGLAGSIIGGTSSLVNPANLTNLRTCSARGFPLSSGLSLYGKIGSDVAAYVNLLQTKNNFSVLSRPSVIVNNNQKGTISSGRRIAVPTNSFNSGATGQSTNIEYRDVVLKLEVVPLVNSSDEISLQISLISDDVIGQSDVIEGIGRVPIIGTRELLTTATIPNNQTIILGGLITESDRKNVTGIPILSSIPGLGRLFSTNSDTKERDELLVFLQPSIVRNELDVDRVQVDTDARYKLAPKARVFSNGPAVTQTTTTTVTNGKNGGGDDYVLPAPAANGNSAMKPSIRPMHRR